MGSSGKISTIYWVGKCFESQLETQILVSENLLGFTPIST